MISFAAFFSRLGETKKTVPAFQSLIDKGVCPDIYFAYTSKEELNMRAFFKLLPIVSLVIFKLYPGKWTANSVRNPRRPQRVDS